MTRRAVRQKSRGSLGLCQPTRARTAIIAVGFLTRCVIARLSELSKSSATAKRSRPTGNWTGLYDCALLHRGRSGFFHTGPNPRARYRRLRLLAVPIGRGGPEGAVRVRNGFGRSWVTRPGRVRRSGARHDDG